MQSHLKLLLVAIIAVYVIHIPAQTQPPTGQQTFLGPITVDVDGSYPTGYQPHWDFVERGGQDIPIITTVVGAKRQNTSPIPWRMSLKMIDGQPTLVYPFYIMVNCVATIMIPNGGSVHIDATPQTFQLTNFRMEPGPNVAVGQICGGRHAYEGPRTWDGSITLSTTNPGGDILMDVVIDMTEGRQLPNHKEARGVVLRNRMTPLIANNDVQRKDQEAKQQASAEAAAQHKRAMDEKAEAALPRIKARAAQYHKTVLSYRGYNMPALVSPMLLANASVCAGASSAFSGAVEKFDKAHMAVQFALATDVQTKDLGVVSRAEPHEKNRLFALTYVFSKAVNEDYINVAAHLTVCDLDGAATLMNAMPKDPTELAGADESEADRISEYLNSH